MATATGTSVFGFQNCMTFTATDAWTAMAFNGAVKPAEGEYVGWLRIHRNNGFAWVEVNSKPIYGGGQWLANVSGTGTHRLSVIWRRSGLVWTAYSGPFA